MKKTIVVNSMLFLILFTVLNACEIEFTDRPNHNEVNATIVFSNGSTVNFNATGAKAEMNNSWFTGTYVIGTNASNAKIYLIIYDFTRSSYGSTLPGTYSFDCKYVPNSTDAYPASYIHAYTDPGTVTITTCDDHNMQGHFNSVVCRTGVDSVRISGSFKGDRLTY